MKLTLTRASIAALVAGIGLTAAFLASPAQAVEESKNRCDVIRHGDTAGFTAAAGGAFALTGDGVLMSTGTTSDADRVDWKATFATPVDADEVTSVSYTTTKQDQAGPNVNDAALTSYRIYVRINGADGVLIYEPYWNTVGNPPRGVETSWNVLTGKLWTSSTTIPGLPKTAGGPPEKTFAQVRTDNPDMLVTGIGLGLGTYNRGTKSLTNDVAFQGGRVCVKHEWSTRFTKPSTSPPASTSPKPSTSPSTSASASAPASTTVTPSSSQVPVGNASQLPVTGTGMTVVGAGILLLVGGIAFLRLGRRRKNV